MHRTYTCILCPNGCVIGVETEDGAVMRVEGNGCQKGKAYAEQEAICPLRNIATSVRVERGASPLVSVRLTAPVPMHCLKEAVAQIHGCRLCAPVRIGQVVLHNVCGTGADVIATRSVPVETTE